MSTEGEVTVTERGREGTVRYREPQGELSLYWEFGGGAVVAVVSAGTEQEWRTKHAWAVERRAEILQRIGAELVRQRAPSCRVEIDDRNGWIQLVPGDAVAGSDSSSPPRPGLPRTSSTAGTTPRTATFSERRAKMAMYLGLVVLALALLAWIGRSLLEIRTSGAPSGSSRRVGDTIATLMTRLEPYIPSLHRDHSKDTYSVGLLLHAVEGDAAPRYVVLARGRTGSELQHAKLLDSAGDLLWFATPEPGAYDVRSGRRYSAADLQQDPRLAPPQRPFSMSDYATGDQSLLLTLAAGGTISESRWLGVLGTEDAAKSFPLGATPTRLLALERSSAPRNLFVGELVRSDARLRLARLDSVPGDALYNGGFVRTARDGELLRLADPAGLLLVHESQRYRAGTVQLSRIDDDGRVLWRCDTGIGALHQVLPDAARPAFVGTRPKVPDVLPEPILVVVDSRNGAMTTRSLWQKD
jgi:hypothetical protein